MASTPHSRNAQPVGEWNQQEVIARGTKIRVVLNGATIVDADLKGIKPLDGRKHAGLSRKSGHLGFMGHGARIEFRHIRLKDLAAKGSVGANNSTVVRVNPVAATGPRVLLRRRPTSTGRQRRIQNQP